MGCDVTSFVDEVTPQFVCARTSPTHFIDPAAPLLKRVSSLLPPPAPPAPLAPLAPAPAPPAHIDLLAASAHQ